MRDLDTPALDDRPGSVDGVASSPGTGAPEPGDGAGGVSVARSDAPGTDTKWDAHPRGTDVGWEDASGPAGPPTPGTLGALTRLALVAAAVVLLAVATHSTAVLIVIVALILMVMVHELGHFVTAKWSHMKVTEYFLGFGPRLWSVRRGETEYGIKAIPAGGYVKIIGMSSLDEVDPADEARTYRQQPFHNRVIVAVAGSFMHFVMAFVLLWAAFGVVGTYSTTSVSIQGFAPPTAHGPDPARGAGLKVGDVVLRVDGTRVSDPDQLSHLIGSHAGHPITLLVDRSGHRRSVTVVPEPVREPNASGHGYSVQGRIGVEVARPITTVGIVHALGTSVVQIGHLTSATVAGLVHLFSPSGIAHYIHVVSSPSAADQAAKTDNRPVSIVGATQVAAQAEQASFGAFLYFLAAINIFIGLFNLLPMLPLDGGHVLVAVYERVRSRRGRMYHADITKLMPVAYAFLLVLGFIVLTSLYLDIAHPVVLK